MTDRPDTETLMAYADGALPPDEARAVEAALLLWPELVAEVSLYRESAEILSSGFAHVADADVPARLINALRADPGNVTGFAAAQQVRAERQRPQWLQAVAACLVAAAAGVAGFVGGRGAAPEPGLIMAAPLPADNWLAAALSAAASGETVTKGGQSVEVIATYVTATDGVCREFEYAEGGNLSGGVACRSGEDWAIAMAVNLGAASATGGYAPASGEAADALGSFLDNSGASDPASLTQEACLARAEWRFEAGCEEDRAD